MKLQFFLPILGAAVAVLFSSCSQNKGTAFGDDAEMATAIAEGTMPPWMAENSGGYETAKYESTGHPAAKSYSYNPPVKPSISKGSSKKVTSGKRAKKSSKISKTSSKSKKRVAKKKTPVVKVHSIKKGDTLGKIAKKYGTTIKAIKSANGMKSDTIQIGKSLKVPKK